MNDGLPQNDANIFPCISTQQMWQFAMGPDHINFSDGNAVYSFVGKLNPAATSYLDKILSVQLPDLFTGSSSRGTVQIHRATPGSFYFTFQESEEKRTYTFRHSAGSKWVAIPKSTRRQREAARNAPYEPRIDIEHIKGSVT